MLCLSEMKAGSGFVWISYIRSWRVWNPKSWRRFWEPSRHLCLTLLLSAERECMTSWCGSRTTTGNWLDKTPLIQSCCTPFHHSSQTLTFVVHFLSLMCFYWFCTVLSVSQIVLLLFYFLLQLNVLHFIFSLQIKCTDFCYQTCIYLNTNTVKTIICEILLKWLFLWWRDWIVCSHYSSLQCHMILQKSFWYADLVLNKHFFFCINSVENSCAG